MAGQQLIISFCRRLSEMGALKSQSAPICPGLLHVSQEYGGSWYVEAAQRSPSMGSLHLATHQHRGVTIDKGSRHSVDQLEHDRGFNIAVAASTRAEGGQNIEGCPCNSKDGSGVYKQWPCSVVFQIE